MSRGELAGGITAAVAGVLMVALSVYGGGLAASLPAIAVLTALLIIAGAAYGRLVESGRLRSAFGPGIVYWSVAFAVARLIFELVAGDPSSRSGLSNGLIGFLIYQAMVGGAFGLGFVLLHNQTTGYLGWLDRRGQEETGKVAGPPG